MFKEKIFSIEKKPHGAELERTLTQLHASTAESVVGGRNVMAGYTRSWGLQYAGLAQAVAQDPIYSESRELARGWVWADEHKLMNLFLIMKYGMADIEGDIVEFGSYKGGAAIFMANVARRLGMKTCVYALDTYRGMPETDAVLDLHRAGDFGDASIDNLRAYAREHELNLVPVQGLFEDTAPALLEEISAVTLAHIDCDIYSAVKFAIDIVRPRMHASGGYLAFDDPLQGSCLGALEAVEDMIRTTGAHAEQAYPHFIYRFPAPAIGASVNVDIEPTGD